MPWTNNASSATSAKHLGRPVLVKPESGKQDIYEKTWKNIKKTKNNNKIWNLKHNNTNNNRFFDIDVFSFFSPQKISKNIQQHL